MKTKLVYVCIAIICAILQTEYGTAMKKNRTIGPWLIWEIHEIRRIS